MAQGKGRSDCPIGKNPGGRPRKHKQRVLNKDLLLQIAMDRGFKTYKEFYSFLVEKIGERNNSKIVKKMAYGSWTYTDICLVSDALEMTPAEFVGVWFTNLFHEVDGRVIAKIPKELRPLYLERKVKSQSAGGNRSNSFGNVKRAMEETAEFLKSID